MCFHAYLTIAKADKSKTMVIINKDTIKQKINTLIEENLITCLNKDPTDFYPEQIQQAIKECDILIEKRTHKYLMNIKPMAPKLKVRNTLPLL